MSEQPTLAIPSPNGGPERVCVRELRDGPVAGAFGVRDRDRRRKRNGEFFLQLSLADGTGAVRAISWDDVDERHALAAPGSVVWVRGEYKLDERFGATLTIRELRAAEPHEYDADELVGMPAVPVERLEADLRELIATIQDRHLGELLERIFGADSEIWRCFREAPAAKHYHQAYRHGLLDHTVSVAQAVSASASAFPGIDRDLAVAGALLHDIGKTEAYNRDALAIDLTDAGRLLGEIPLGYYLVRREIDRMEAFDPALARGLLHIILSHHGTLENGSPVVPCTREATLVHAIDNLGGKLGSFDRIERELPDGETWSRFDRGIDGAAYFASRAA